jgi:hypothetical protein
MVVSTQSFAAVPIDMQNKITGVRLQDILNADSSAIKGLDYLVTLIKKNPELFFKQGQVEVVHDVFIRKLPLIYGSSTSLEVVAFVRYKNNFFTFEKFNISYTYTNGPLSQVELKPEVIYQLKDMNFEASVGLVDRKLIVEDSEKNIKMLFPIGVGSFDEGTMNEGKTSLLTPRFRYAFIEQKEVISERSKPRYFQGKPFIRISKSQDGNAVVTPIGFHIEINDEFVRGFDSHGCMRLREKDLMAFHDLIVFGSNPKIPLNIQYRLSDNSDSPVAKRNKIFKTILNKGSKESPFFILDRDNLVQLVYKENQLAPFDKLVDDADDIYEDLFSYDTRLQMREQDERRKNECQVKVMNGIVKSDSDSFQECLDAGKRKDSFSDRIYRRFMGIEDFNSNLI